MRDTIIMAFVLVLMNAVGADAAEKSWALLKIDATRGAIEGFAARVRENKAATGDLEMARTSLKKAEEVYEKGRQMFGFGDVKPEAEQDIKHYTGMAELAISLGNSRIEKARAETEFELLGKQLAAVKDKLKVFEDRKAEIEKIKADAAKMPLLSKELETVKSEKALLATQVELLMAERGRSDKLKDEKIDLVKKIEELKAENARLMEQVEKMKAEVKVQEVQPSMKVPVNGNTALKEPTAEKEISAPKETPALNEQAQPALDTPAPVTSKPENKDASAVSDSIQVNPVGKK